MIYIYRPNASDGASALEDALNDIGSPARFTRGKLLRERFRPDRDALVSWGAYWDGEGCQRKLNNVAPLSKFSEALNLKEKGVNTVEVSQTRPANRPATRGTITLQLDGGVVRSQDGGFEMAWDEAAARHTIQELQRYLDAPLPPAYEWLPRRNNHIGGSDLLRPGAADYFSRKESIVNEYRVHIFNGKSIRAGRKIPREDFAGQPHPWVRSFDGGWKIDYTGFNSTKPQRDIAAKAVAALGLDFGAVDLGERADGSLIVFEVNRAPGIEGGTVQAYAEKIALWSRGELARAA